MLQKPFYRATASWTASDRRGRQITRSATAVSPNSLEDAERIAKEDARRLAEEAAEGRGGARGYGYGNRLKIEPVIQRIGVAGTPGSAFVSVNGYGSRVLNAEQLMFVDVDLEPPRPVGFFSRLFGSKEEPRDPSAEALDRLADVIAGEPHSRVRVYRTAAGLRYIFVNRPYSAVAPETGARMTKLKSDAKFVLLCRVQKCFRARLSPKPWRCGFHATHPKFDENSERPDPLYEEWQSGYEKAVAGFATCQFLDEYGNGQFDPALRELVTLHDRQTRSESGLPLA